MTSDLAEFLDQAFIDTLHRAHLVLVERAEAGEEFRGLARCQNYGWIAEHV